MGLSAYGLAWGSAAVFFAIGGALLLDQKCRMLGHRSNALLRMGPGLAVILALTGAKIHPFLGRLGELPEIFAAGNLGKALNQSGQRIAGGLLLAAFFLGIVLPRLGPRRLDGWDLLDVLAPLSGLAMAIGRLGCLAAGCCFGTLGKAFFCLEHARGSPAWWNHFARGLLPEDSLASLPVHPLPLYLIAAGLLASALACRAAHQSQPSGVPFLLFVAVFCGCRLGVESWRETILLVEIPFQTRMDQSLLLGALAGIFWRRNRPPEVEPATQPSRSEGSSRPGMPSA
jgi:prolipoprotein diacylglyceryltransferase